MSRGISLHVGINKVSSGAFSAVELAGCENDATRMHDIARFRGFQPDDARLLRGPDATFQNVDAEIKRAAGLLNEGDIFFFTFAGHGSRIPDEERLQSEEPDRKDEALVLYDRLMLDDYLRRVLWPEFKPGVRIVGVADSCHSASALFALPADEGLLAENLAVAAFSKSGPGPAASARHAVKNRWRDTSDVLPEEDPAVVEIDVRERALTPEARREHREVRFKSFYDNLGIPSPANARPIQAQLITMAACEDGKTTRDDVPNGAFTTALLEVWRDGAFPGTYIEFMREIKDIIRDRFPGQVPVITIENPPAFSGQQPFSIG